MINAKMAKQIADEKMRIYREQAKSTLEEIIQRRIGEMASIGYYCCQVLVEVPSKLNASEYEVIINEIVNYLIELGYFASYTPCIENIRYEITVNWEE